MYAQELQAIEDRRQQNYFHASIVLVVTIVFITGIVLLLYYLYAKSTDVAFYVALAICLAFWFGISGYWWIGASCHLLWFEDDVSGSGLCADCCCNLIGALTLYPFWYDMSLRMVPEDPNNKPFLQL